MDDRAPGGWPLVLAWSLVLGAALALRLHDLGGDGFWYDELYTLWFSDPSVAFGDLFADRLMKETNPPLYYLLLRAWRSLVPTDEVMVRLPSAVFGTLAAAAPLLVRGHGLSRAAALLYAILMATGAGLVDHGREARAYPLLMFVSALASLQVLAMAAAIGRGEGARHGGLARLAATLIVAAGVHFYGIHLAAGCFGAVLLAGILAGGPGWRDGARVVAWGLGTGALMAAWAAAQYVAIGPLAGDFWIEGSLRGALGAYAHLGDLMFGRRWLAAMVGVAGAVLFVGRYGRRLARRDGTLAVEPAPVAGVIVAGTMAWAHLASAVVPMILARYMLVTAPPILIGLAALVLPSGRPWRLPAGAFLAGVAAVFALACLPLIGFDAWPKEDWRGAAARIQAEPGCRGATVLAVDHGPLWPTGREPLYRHYLDPAIGLAMVRREDASPAHLSPGSPCRVLLWAGHTGEGRLMEVLAGLGLDPGAVDIVPFGGVYVVLAR